MLRNTNIDRSDEQLNTKAPFEFSCPLALGAVILPPCAFLSVRVYLTEEMTAPVSITSLQAVNNSVVVTFRDAGRRLVGSWTAYNRSESGIEYVSDVIENEHGVIAGHVTVQTSVPALLFAACSASPGGRIQPDRRDFVLLPQCCVQQFKGRGKSFVVSGKGTTADLRLSTSIMVPCELDNSSGHQSVRIGVMGEFGYPVVVNPGGYAQIGYDYITKVRIAGRPPIDCRGQHLLVQAGYTSNLRVTTGDTIKFSGVLDE